MYAYLEQDLCKIFYTNKRQNLSCKIEPKRQVAQKLLSIKQELNATKLVIARQIHSNNVQIVDNVFGKFTCDGLITTQKNVALGVLLADCLGVALFDEKVQIIGVFHAGWRGLASKILENGVKEFTKLGSNPKDIKAYLSPCISGAVYEVGQEVFEQFAHLEVAKSFFKNGKYFVDLRACAEEILFKNGLKIVQKSTKCTAKDNDILFSYRYEQTDKRFGFFAKLL